MDKDMKIVIAGGRAKADYLIKIFLSKGHELIVINDDMDYCKYLSRLHNIPVVYGDPCKLYVLDEADIADSDIMIALLPGDADNLVICQTAKRIYHIKKTVALVTNPKSVDVFKKLGVNTAISATYTIAAYIEQMSTVESLVNSLPLDQGKIVLNELMIIQSSPVIGQKLCDIDLGDDAIVCCIIRGAKIIVPSGHTSIQINDKIMVLSTPESQNQVLNVVMGERGKGAVR